MDLKRKEIESIDLFNVETLRRVSFYIEEEYATDNKNYHHYFLHSKFGCALSTAFDQISVYNFMHFRNAELQLAFLIERFGVWYKMYTLEQLKIVLEGDTPQERFISLHQQLTRLQLDKLRSDKANLQNAYRLL